MNPMIKGTLDGVLGPIGTHKPDAGFDVAMEDWRKPYVKKWIRHHNPSDPFLIKDKDLETKYNISLDNVKQAYPNMTWGNRS